MSNDKCKSIEHRAIANRSKNRVSIPYFVSPRSDATIGPLPEVLASGETPIYKHVVYSDYLKHFVSKGHDGKNTVEFAKIWYTDLIYICIWTNVFGNSDNKYHSSCYKYSRGSKLFIVIIFLSFFIVVEHAIVMFCHNFH